MDHNVCINLLIRYKYYLHFAEEKTKHRGITKNSQDFTDSEWKERDKPWDAQLHNEHSLACGSSTSSEPWTLLRCVYSSLSLPNSISHSIMSKCNSNQDVIYFNNPFFSHIYLTSIFLSIDCKVGTGRRQVGAKTKIKTVLYTGDFYYCLFQISFACYYVFEIMSKHCHDSPHFFIKMNITHLTYLKYYFFS